MKKFLDLVMDIGEQMLISGAEVHRVEESIKRMCNSKGAKRVDVFIITSSMIVTVFDNEDKSYTQTRRIISSTTDFEKLHKLNQLSRKICEGIITYEEIKTEFNSALNCKTYNFFCESLCCAIIAGAFTIFFGGNTVEMVVSFIVGLLVSIGNFLCNKAVTNKIFSKFFGSLLVTMFAFSAVKFGFVDSADNVIIGNIMTLIPGIGLTNALRDLFIGDSIAGLLRTIEAVLLALGIAAGYFLVTIFVGGIV
jgi:uncharacterized membrane protein YjjP (DUF1212 family)